MEQIMESQYYPIKLSTDCGFLRVNYLNTSGKLASIFSGKTGQHTPLFFNVSCLLQI